MIRSVTTLAFGVALAVCIVVVAVLSAVWVIGMATKAALFGEPRVSLAMKLFERLRRTPTGITRITPNERETDE